MDSQMRNPSSYDGWLGRLLSSNDSSMIYEAAKNIALLAPDKKKARLDVAKILTDRYEIEKNRVGHNQILERTVRNKYDIMAKTLFGSGVDAMVGYVRAIEEAEAEKKQ